MSAGQTVRLVGESQRAFAHRLIDLAPADAILNIKGPTRSNEQSALMWVLLSDISRAKPQGRCHTAEVWKNLCMHACGHAVQFQIGLDGQPFPVGFRSSRLSKADMSTLIEWIYAWGTENGVRWSEPRQQV